MIVSEKDRIELKMRIFFVEVRRVLESNTFIVVAFLPDREPQLNPILSSSSSSPHLSNARIKCSPLSNHKSSYPLSNKFIWLDEPLRRSWKLTASVQY